MVIVPCCLRCMCGSKQERHGWQLRTGTSTLNARIPVRGYSKPEGSSTQKSAHDARLISEECPVSGPEIFGSGTRRGRALRPLGVPSLDAGGPSLPPCCRGGTQNGTRSCLLLPACHECRARGRNVLRMRGSLTAYMHILNRFPSLPAYAVVPRHCSKSSSSTSGRSQAPSCPGMLCYPQSQYSTRTEGNPKLGDRYESRTGSNLREL